MEKIITLKEWFYGVVSERVNDSSSFQFYILCFIFFDSGS